VEEIYYCICFLKKAIKMTAVIKEYYHCYQLQTKISPIILSQGYLHIYIYICVKLLRITSVDFQYQI